MTELNSETFGPGGSVLVADDGDVGEVSVLLGIVQSVSNDEFVLDGEADVFHRHVDLAARRLAEETRGPQVPRRAGAEDVLQIRQREARVDDVFDDDDIASQDGAVEILEHLYLPRGLGAVAIAGDRHEIERRLRGERPREVGEKDERAL